MRAASANGRNATVLQASATTANSGNTSHSLLIKNKEHYDNEITVPADAAFLARYFGSLGNSLKVSVCDSNSAWESTVSNTMSGGDSCTANITVGNTELLQLKTQKRLLQVQET